MTRSWQISRRRALRGLGASLALPWLEVMGAPSGAAKENGRPPVRFVSIFQPNGVHPASWDVTGEGRNFELSPILSPLKHLKSEISVLSGLDNITRGGGHVGLTSGFLTGVGVQNRENAVSLDQQIAQQIGGKARLPSIELGTEPPRQGSDGGQPIAYANTVSWSSETTRLSPEINPRLAFDRLFRSQTSPDARREAENRLSVIDLVLDDAKTLRGRVSSADQRKLDEYLESVRTVEVQIERSLNPPDPDWVPLTTPDLVAPAPGIPRERDQHLRQMMEVLVLALQTDSTRVATLMTAHGFSRQVFGFIEGVVSDHHGMSHHKNQEDLVAEYRRVSTWYVEQVAWLLERMRSIDEGNGSLLDNSIVLYGSSMKDGNGHMRNDIPMVVAGRGGGALDPGRHIISNSGTPLANLHLSVAQHMGLEIDSFNEASTGTVNV